MMPKWFHDFWLCDIDPAGVKLLKALETEHASSTRRVNVLEEDFNEKALDLIRHTCSVIVTRFHIRFYVTHQQSNCDDYNAVLHCHTPCYTMYLGELIWYNKHDGFFAFRFLTVGRGAQRLSCAARACRGCAAGCGGAS
jgi:hypothetical protein